MAVTTDARMPKSIPIEVKASPHIEQDSEKKWVDGRNAWMNLIISYIQDRTLPADKMRA